MENLPELTAEPTESRSVTLEEAISIAVLLQKNEQFADAEKLYRMIFEVAPEHPDALHHAGVLAHQQGRSEEAIALIEKSLRIVPDRADCYSNLGIILQTQDKLDEAIAAYRRAIALDPGHANAHSNLGVLLRATGKPDEAEAAYRTAIRLDANHIDAYTNLGVLLNGLKRTAEAVACFCKVITLRPQDKEARRLLALAHCAIGEIDSAVKIFKEWLEEEPDEPIARHMLAACTGSNTPERASDQYVEKIFDGFAASFDSKLAKLSYRAPMLVATMLEESGIQPAKNLDVLDAGCGTGLCGPLVAPYARRLTGVDLSAGMLTQAKDKNVYDELVRGELTAYLTGSPQMFDVIVSADTLVYFGGLEEVFAAAARALRPGGVMVFTLEHAVDTDATVHYRLELHGRYSHSRAYVEGLLAGVGLAPEIEQAHLRMESGSPVSGLVIRATKAPGARGALASTSPGAETDANAERGVGERVAEGGGEGGGESNA